MTVPPFAAGFLFLQMAERIKIRVVPNAPKSECVGPYGDAVKIKIAAQAVDGKANAELVKFLSKTLKVPKKAITIVTGDTSRDKLVEIEGAPYAANILLSREQPL